MRRYNACCYLLGKITSLDTSTMRAAMKPGWEDLVRRCIQKFHAQHEGESVSYAKRHHHEGNRLYAVLFLKSILLNYCFFMRALSETVIPESTSGDLDLVTLWVHTYLASSCPELSPPEGKLNRRTCEAKSVMKEIELGMIISQRQMKGKGKRSLSLMLRLLDV